jgi:phosphoglycerate dehydrogenase-like enzyme
MRRLKVLLLPQKKLFHPWCDDVIQAIGQRHDLFVFDETQPLAPQFDGVEVVIDHGGSVGTRAMMDVAKDARLWQILGTGFDHFDLDYIRHKGIPVANCPGPFSSVALAEMAVMFILMLARRYHQAVVNFQSAVLYTPMGRELKGQNVGIIGFGASGQDLARRAKAFGMQILAIDIRSIEAAVLNEIQPDFLGTPADLDWVVAESDFLSLHLHLDATTRHIIDERRLALMKPTACLINVARGALVDEAALYQALTAGKLGGAGLDVFSQEPPSPTAPLFQLPNVVVTPHIAGATYETSRRRAWCAAQNVDRLAQGLPPLYQIET